LSATLTSGYDAVATPFEFLPEYSYNKSWGSMANFDIKSSYYIGQYFEMLSAIQLSTANVYTFQMTARPRLPLPVGELFLDVEPYYRAVVRNKIHDACIALSLGYRFDYLSFQFGWSGRFLVPFSGSGYAKELTNLLYRVEVFCRPQFSEWNISGGAAHIDDFQIERWQMPFFFLGGRYDFANMFRLSALVEVKPAGMTHGQGSFYGITARVGIGFILR